MENQQGYLKAGQVEWTLQKTQVALAVSIIKNRPEGMSGREHAEALSCKLRREDESWKKKAQELQQEVLRLRQESLIARVTSNTKSSTETAGQGNSTDVSQDLFGPGSLASDSETPDLLLEDPQPPPQPPPLPPLSPPQPPVPNSPPSQPVLPHVLFLQSLCALQRVDENSRDLGSLWFCSDGDAGSVLVDSVCQLLDSVVSACRNPPPLGPDDLVLQGCRAAAKAMDLFCSQRLPSVEFMKRVEEPLRELTGLLLHSHRLDGLQAPEKLMEYLITLGSNSMSKSFLIRHILSEISTLADQLWQAFQDQESSALDQFPVDQYLNSCFLFSILEQLLQTSKIPCRVELGSDQSGFLRHLEQRVFLLSTEFPLFSIYMWRIGSLLTSSDNHHH